MPDDRVLKAIRDCNEGRISREELKIETLRAVTPAKDQAKADQYAAGLPNVMAASEAVRRVHPLNRRRK